MAGVIEARLRDLGIELPRAAAPAANYVPFARVGGTVWIAGQITVWNGDIRYRGKLGRDFGVEEGYRAARLCGLNLLAQLRAACAGDLDRVERCCRLGGFVNAGADFVDHPKVINGASDLMVEVFGDKGRHARTAVGCSALPFDAATEVDAIFAVA